MQRGACGSQACSRQHVLRSAPPAAKVNSCWAPGLRMMCRAASLRHPSDCRLTCRLWYAPLPSAVHASGTPHSLLACLVLHCQGYSSFTALHQGGKQGLSAGGSAMSSADAAAAARASPALAGPQPKGTTRTGLSVIGHQRLSFDACNFFLQACCCSSVLPTDTHSGMVACSRAGAQLPRHGGGR